MRIAASTYLNSAPLVYSFARAERAGGIEFLGDTAPARCAEMLRTGLCEVALIPVIEYQRIARLRLIPEVAVASKERVRSVILAARRPLRDVRRVALDTSSRTSQTLLRILCRRHFGIEPEFIERTPEPGSGCENMFEGNEAALLIGDPAMQIEAAASERGLEIYDLAAEWRAMTGLPFVFAVWATRAEVEERYPGLAERFIAAKAEGLAHREEIASRYAAEIGLPYDELLDYLCARVNYDLDEENIEGLSHYFELAHQEGLIAANRALEFLSPTDEK